MRPSRTVSRRSRTASATPPTGGRSAACKQVTRSLRQTVPVGSQHHREGGSVPCQRGAIWLRPIVLDQHHEGVTDLCVHDHLEAQVGHVEVVCEDPCASNDCAIVDHAIDVMEGPIRIACRAAPGVAQEAGEMVDAVGGGHQFAGV